jgi:GT2 family glycosyltransferase
VTGGTVLVVVVSRDTREETVACARSVLDRGAVPGRRTRLVVVDNASSDGTVEALRAAFGLQLDLLANLTNAGFGAACNRGAALQTDAEHVLFLNADVELLPGALVALVAELDRHPESAACGPRIVGNDGAPQPSVRGHPTRLSLLHQHTILRFLRAGAAAYRRYKEPVVPPAGGPVEVVMGACLLVRGEDFRALHGFDPRYFLYFEEADLQRRFQALHRTVRFVPRAVVRHSGGSSSRQDPERALTWYLRSLFAYVDRWHGRSAGLAFRAAFKPLFAAKLVTDAVRDALALAFRGRAGKRDELRLAAQFLFRGFWSFLTA